MRATISSYHDALVPQPLHGEVTIRPEARRRSDGYPSVRDSLPLQAIVTSAVFALFWQLSIHYTTLPFAGYTGPSIFASSVQWTPLWLITLLMAAPLFLTWPRSGWRSVDASGATRVFVFIVAMIFGWTFSTYNTNLFFGQEHTIDRLALIALSALVWIHPAFFVLQLLAVLVVLGQLHYPLPEPAWHFPDKRLPLDALILFAAFLQVRLVFRAEFKVYLYCLLCLVAVVYGYPAIAKLGLGPRPWSWVLDNNLSNLFVSAHTNGGWLGSLPERTVAGIAQALDHGRVPMAVATILVELSALFILVHPRATRWIPVALIAMHVSILLTSGIFFWKWMVFHGALLWYAGRVARNHLVGVRETWSGGIYRWRMVALAPVVMFMMWISVPFSAFVWADTRMANFFVLRGIGESGAVYRLEPRFFAPYDLTIQQSRFYFAFQEPVLAGTFGTTGRFELARRLEAAGVEDLPDIREEFGQIHFDQDRAEALNLFLERSVANAMRAGRRNHWLYRFRPPHHFRAARPPDAYAFQEPLTAVTMTFEEWFWDGRTLRRTREVPVSEIRLLSHDVARGVSTGRVAGPKFDVMTDTTIVVPCYNEEARLRPDAFVAYVAGRPEVELLFVDDGSTDGTRRVLDAMRAAAPAAISVLALARNAGKAEAVRAGVEEGLLRGRDAVGYWDADLSTPLEAIDEFRRVLVARPEVALVMGARVKLLGRRIERLESRHYLGRAFATAVSLVLRLPVYDTQCGAKLFRATAEAKAVFATPFRSRWIFDVEILARMIRYRRAGGERLEHAVVEHPLAQWRHVRGSKLRPVDFFLAAKDLAVIHHENLRAGAPLLPPADVARPVSTRAGT